MVAGGFLHTPGDQIEIVFRDWITGRLAAHGLDLRGQDERVVFQNVPGVELRSYRDKLRACRQDRDARLARYLYALMTRRGNRAQVNRPQDVTRRQNKLRGDNIFSHRADMTPRRDRGADADGMRRTKRRGDIPRLIQGFGVFDRNNCIGPFRQGVAGIHILSGRWTIDGVRWRGKHREHDRRCRLRPAGILGADGEAVHGRGVIVRRGDFRPDWLSQHTAQGVLAERDRFHAEHAPQAGIVQRGFEAGAGFGERDVVEVEGHYIPPPRPSPTSREGARAALIAARMISSAEGKSFWTISDLKRTTLSPSFSKISWRTRSVSICKSWVGPST